MTDGIRVAKPGYAVESATPPQLVYSSEYATLRVQQQGSGTVTHTGGRIATIAHNLGYVPMFIVSSTLPNFASSSYYFRLPYKRYNATFANPYLLGESVSVYADSTNLYIKANNDLGYVHFSSNDTYEESAFNVRGYFGYGHNFDGWGVMRGAIRFGSVTVPNQTIYDAKVGFLVNSRTGSSNMYVYMWGIDEDNTADFSSNPMGRPRTDYRHRPEGNHSAGSFVWYGCKEAVQEVLNRGGWSSGNNLGLMFRDEAPDGQSPDGNGLLSTTGYQLLYIVKDNTLLNYKYTIFKDRIE